MESTIEKSKLAGIGSLLRIIYGVVPIAAGLDKFTNLLVNWTIYINPLMLKIMPLSGTSLMHIVGVIEIAAGVIVLARPKIGAYIVSAWLLCISLSLLASGHYLDVAVRDLVMSIGSYALARISVLVDQGDKVKSGVFASQYR